MNFKPINLEILLAPVRALKSFTTEGYSVAKAVGGYPKIGDYNPSQSEVGLTQRTGRSIGEAVYVYFDPLFKFTEYLREYIEK